MAVRRCVTDPCRPQVPDNDSVTSDQARPSGGVRTKARRLVLTSIAETLSFVALLGAMFLESEAGVSLLGATHGLLFLAYALFVWVDHDELGWTTTFAVGSIVTGPLGAIIVLERLRRERPDPPSAAL